MEGKNEVAAQLAGAHRRVDPHIVRIVRVISDHENESNEPVKLLEVNPLTAAVHKPVMNTTPGLRRVYDCAEE